MRIRALLPSWLAAVALFSLTGCAGTLPPPAQWKSEPDIVMVEYERFRVHLKPVFGNSGGCEAFVLSIVNKTDKNIRVNWNKTLYISGGHAAGGLMAEGAVSKDRDNPKPPDVVPGNATLTRTIWPDNLAHYDTGRKGGWRHEAMPPGENGAYVSLSINGREVSESLIFRLSIVRP
jgi:hypothetical protein